MNISWVFSDSLSADPLFEPGAIKEIGSIWGSWRTWRTCATDNVICHDFDKAQDLIKRNFHLNCNFYIPADEFVNLGRPNGVKTYQGNFSHAVDNREEIIAMHLASANSDLVLLLGFDFGEKPALQDKLLDHRAHNYRSLIKSVISQQPDVQWVLINHPVPTMKFFENLTNLTQDRLENALKLLT
jgi:hypothetical protein